MGQEWLEDRDHWLGLIVDNKLCTVGGGGQRVEPIKVSLIETVSDDRPKGLADARARFILRVKNIEQFTELISEVEALLAGKVDQAVDKRTSTIIYLMRAFHDRPVADLKKQLELAGLRTSEGAIQATQRFSDYIAKLRPRIEIAMDVNFDQEPGVHWFMTQMNVQSLKHQYMTRSDMILGCIKVLDLRISNPDGDGRELLRSPRSDTARTARADPGKGACWRRQKPVSGLKGFEGYMRVAAYVTPTTGGRVGKVIACSDFYSGSTPPYVVAGKLPTFPPRSVERGEFAVSFLGRKHFLPIDLETHPARADWRILAERDKVAAEAQCDGQCELTLVLFKDVFKLVTQTKKANAMNLPSIAKATTAFFHIFNKMDSATIFEITRDSEDVRKAHEELRGITDQKTATAYVKKVTADSPQEAALGGERIDVGEPDGEGGPPTVEKRRREKLPAHGHGIRRTNKEVEGAAKVLHETKEENRRISAELKKLKDDIRELKAELEIQKKATDRATGELQAREADLQAAKTKLKEAKNLLRSCRRLEVHPLRVQIGDLTEKIATCERYCEKLKELLETNGVAIPEMDPDEEAGGTGEESPGEMSAVESSSDGWSDEGVPLPRRPSARGRQSAHATRTPPPSARRGTGTPATSPGKQVTRK
jgi:hypothetical protein